MLDLESPDVARHVQAFTSNTDRTISSAHSFLLGCLPEVAVAFTTEECPPTEAERQAITLTIADTSTQYKPLLHGYKGSPAYDVLLKRAFATSTYFSEQATRPEVAALVDKLWRMSSFEKLDPGTPLPTALQYMQSVQQQLMIERAHRMPLLANEGRTVLEHHEEDVIRRLADYCMRLRYEGLRHEEQREMSRLAAGTLPAEICRRFRGRLSGEDQTRLAVYSAHDNTLMAMLAHLGLRSVPTPLFSAYIAFELHAEGTAAKEPYIRIAYNNDPTHVPLPSHDYLELPEEDAIVEYEQAISRLPCCNLDHAEFERRLFHERRSFRSVDEWRFAGHAPSCGELMTKPMA
uniref:Acid phosphatase n=1 Tax=Coccolithus braarudii TaxID=221442 RepID=A0A7S0LNJ0_9EUKA